MREARVGRGLPISHEPTFEQMAIHVLMSRGLILIDKPPFDVCGATNGGLPGLRSRSLGIHLEPNPHFFRFRGFLSCQQIRFCGNFAQE